MNENTFEINNLSKYIESFYKICFTKLKNLTNDYKRVIYKDHISTSTAYTLYIDLEN